MLDFSSNQTNITGSVVEERMNLGNHCFSYTGVYDKDSRQQEKPSRVDTVSSTPISGSVIDLSIGNIVADGDVGHNNFYKIKKAYPMPNLGAAGCCDLGHLHMHLEDNYEPSNASVLPSVTNGLGVLSSSRSLVGHHTSIYSAEVSLPKAAPSMPSHHINWIIWREILLGCD